LIDIGTVRGYEVEKNKDADDDTLLLQVEFMGEDDLQTVELIRGSGVDCNPQPGSRVIVLDITPSYRVAIAIDDGLVPAVDPGEREIYSYDDALAKMAFINLAVDGTITIENGSSSVVTIDASDVINITNGSAEIELSSGQVSVNGGNLTVD